MAVQKVLRIGDSRLSKPSEPVDLQDKELIHGIVTDMLDTMRELNGAGIAAPQIARFYRIIMFEINQNPRYPDVEAVPLTILINPQWEFIGFDRDEAWEGCLSVPGMRGLVPRYSHIRYSGWTLEGEFINREVQGFHARVFQHEYDHLDGILYPGRIEDFSKFGFIPELEASGLIPAIANVEHDQ